jgi:hypothetical protein
VQGFNAAVGWDATTGWGTPNVGNLAQMLMNMSPAPPSSFTWGPDVSSAQGTVTWSSVQAAGASFAFAQASQGTSYTDPQFAANWQGISSAGLVRGAYHYGNPCNSGVQEATNFVNVVQAQGALSPNDMLVLNIQTSCSNPPDGSIESYITNFLTQVSQSTSSSNLMIYTRMSALSHFLFLAPTAACKLAITRFASLFCSCVVLERQRGRQQPADVGLPRVGVGLHVIAPCPRGLEHVDVLAVSANVLACCMTPETTSMCSCCAQVEWGQQGARHHRHSKHVLPQPRRLNAHVIAARRLPQSLR